MDRRNGVQKFSLILLVVAAALALISTAAISGPNDDTGPASLREHAEALIKVLAVIIIALFSALVGVVVWNIKDIKNSIRDNHDELWRELDRKVNKDACEARHE